MLNKKETHVGSKRDDHSKQRQYIACSQRHFVSIKFATTCTRKENLLEIVNPQIEQEPLPDPDQLILSLYTHLFLNLALPSEKLDHAQNIHRWKQILAICLCCGHHRARTFADSLHSFISLKGQIVKKKKSFMIRLASLTYPFHPLNLHGVEQLSKFACWSKISAWHQLIELCVARTRKWEG